MQVGSWLVSRGAEETEGAASGLLPLFIILGVFITLAVAWFVLSSCLGDHMRSSIHDKLSSLFGKRRSRTYGRMRDEEAEAFDIGIEDDDVFHDQEYHQDDQPSHSRHS